MSKRQRTQPPIGFILSPGGKDIGVELQETDPDWTEPLWAIHVDTLVSAAELLAFAEAIRQRFRSEASASKVTRTLAQMREFAPPARHYPCDCGSIIETLWPNQRVMCLTCETRYRETVEGGERVLRKLGSERVIHQVR